MYNICTNARSYLQQIYKVFVCVVCVCVLFSISQSSERRIKRVQINRDHRLVSYFLSFRQQIANFRSFKSLKHIKTIEQINQNCFIAKIASIQHENDWYLIEMPIIYKFNPAYVMYIYKILYI